jgi:hypothetical protein
MTDAICSSNRQEKLYSSPDDEPLVCEAKPQKADPNRSASGADKTNAPACSWDDVVESAGTREPSFGAFATYDASGSNVKRDSPNAGAHGAGQSPEAHPEAPPDTKVTTRGPGIAIGVQGSAALGAGPGLAVSFGAGVVFHRQGASVYVTDSKLPGHCEAPNGEPELCSKGVGATRGVGLSVQLMPDVDAAEGEGQTASFDTPGGSLTASYLPNDKFTSFGVVVGPSVGYAAHVDHTDTTIRD